MKSAYTQAMPRLGAGAGTARPFRKGSRVQWARPRTPADCAEIGTVDAYRSWDRNHAERVWSVHWGRGGFGWYHECDLVAVYSTDDVARELGVPASRIANNWLRHYTDTPPPARFVRGPGRDGRVPLWDEEGLKEWRRWRRLHRYPPDPSLGRPPKDNVALYSTGDVARELGVPASRIAG